MFKHNALVMECLMHAKNARTMGAGHWMRNCPDRFQSARQWLARAREWRLHGERELALNAAWIAANPNWRNYR